MILTSVVCGRLWRILESYRNSEDDPRRSVRYARTGTARRHKTRRDPSESTVVRNFRTSELPNYRSTNHTKELQYALLRYRIEAMRSASPAPGDGALPFCAERD
jgi:hypothetical protein